MGCWRRRAWASAICSVRRPRCRSRSRARRRASSAGFRQHHEVLLRRVARSGSRTRPCRCGAWHGAAGRPAVLRRLQTGAGAELRLPLSDSEVAARVAARRARGGGGAADPDARRAARRRRVRRRSLRGPISATPRTDSEVEVEVTYAADLASCDVRARVGGDGGRRRCRPTPTVEQHARHAPDQRRMHRRRVHHRRDLHRGARYHCRDVLRRRDVPDLRRTASPTRSGIGSPPRPTASSPPTPSAATTIRSWRCGPGTARSPQQQACVDDSGGTLQSKVAHAGDCKDTTYLIQVGHGWQPRSDAARCTSASASRPPASRRPSRSSRPRYSSSNSPTFCSANSGSRLRARIRLHRPRRGRAPEHGRSRTVNARFEPSGNVSNFQVVPRSTSRATGLRAT